MVVLAASICTRGGKPVISRQFRELTKDRVTSLLANFPTLLSSATNTQHTSVEDEFVRYVYRPLEEFYVVLITNKHSNILQDINTLDLFTRVINSILRKVDEREIFDNCFELLTAFDEIVTLGYKENLDVNNIMEFLAMDSHEERIQEIIDRNKEMETNEASKRKAMELKMKELSKKHFAEYGGLDQYNGYQQQSQIPQFQQQVPQQQLQQQYYEEPSMVPESRQERRGGLQLGKRAGSIAVDSQPLLVQQQQQQQQRVQQQATPSESTKPTIPNNGILLTLNEKFSAQITREGAFKSAEVKGDLQIRVNDPELTFVKIKVSTAASEGESEVSTQFKTHPNIDKKLFNGSSIIALKDPSKPFPSNDQNLGVLRWRSTLKSNDSESCYGLLPIILTTWVNNNNDGTIGITIEYEADVNKLIDSASIVIPILNASLESSDYDNARLSFTDDGVMVKITELLEHPSGSLELLARDTDDEEALFPMEVNVDMVKALEDGQTPAGVSIEGVQAIEDDSNVDHDVYYTAASEGYYVI